MRVEVRPGRYVTERAWRFERLRAHGGRTWREAGLSGPWESEPDKVQWVHESGVPCVVNRNLLGSWCGYAGVWPEHPFYHVEYGDCALPTARRRDETEVLPTEWFGRPIPEFMLERMAAERRCGGEGWCGHRPDAIVSVHGGLTFAGFGQDWYEETRSNGELGEGKVLPAEYGISVIPDDNQPWNPDPWFFGFDCGHSGDFVVGLACGLEGVPGVGAMWRNRYREGEDTYREVAYVREQTEALAAQLGEIGEGYTWEREESWTELLDRA